MKVQMRLITGILFLTAFLHPGSFAGTGEEHGGKMPGMQTHHFHIMMNHGIAMVAEGSNLVMLAGMKMTPDLDRPTFAHGQVMIANGKKVILRSLSGPEMMDMMKGEDATSPLMKYTHALGEAMLVVIDNLEKMDMKHMSSSESMTMHHMHITLNHALKMSAEGSNLVMLGQMGMAGKVDEFSIEHGKMMISNARALYTETMEGKAMKFMHGLGVTPENSPMMKLTYDLAESILKVIDLLGRMKPISTG